MTVEELQPLLREEWKRIKEEMLTDHRLVAPVSNNIAEW